MFSQTKAQTSKKPNSKFVDKTYLLWDHLIELVWASVRHKGTLASIFTQTRSNHLFTCRWLLRCQISVRLLLLWRVIFREGNISSTLFSASLQKFLQGKNAKVCTVFVCHGLWAICRYLSGIYPQRCKLLSLFGHGFDCCRGWGILGCLICNLLVLIERIKIFHKFLELFY